MLLTSALADSAFVPSNLRPSALSKPIDMLLEAQRAQLASQLLLEHVNKQHEHAIAVSRLLKVPPPPAILTDSASVVAAALLQHSMGRPNLSGWPF